jgi:hypothetical protein
MFQRKKYPETLNKSSLAELPWTKPSEPILKAVWLSYFENI